MRTRYPIWIGAILFILAVAFIIGLTLANYQLVLDAPGGNDFLPRWMGARYWLLDGVNPYDEEVSEAIQVAMYGHPARIKEDVVQFAYPLPSILIFAPYGLLPFTIARAVWMTTIELCLLGLVVVGMRAAQWRPRTVITAALMLFSVIWYHGLRSVIVGQIAVITALFMVGALLAIVRRNDALGGLLIALSIVKPQMSYIFIPYVLVWTISRRRWGLLAWTLVALGAFVGISLFLMPDWPFRWLAQVMEYPNYTSSPGSPILVIASALPRYAPIITNVLGGALVVYMLVEWVLAWGKDERWFFWTATLTIVVTQLLTFASATTNFVVLILPLIMIYKTWFARWPKAATWAFGISLAVLALGEWLLFLVTIEGRQESPLMHLPLPILTFFGLLWIRWWTIRSNHFSGVA